MPSVTQARTGVFISYARRDGEEFATHLREQLRTEGIPLWRDREGMEGGRDWWLQITEALNRVEFMVLLITPEALRSKTVRKERRYARQQACATGCAVSADGAMIVSASRDQTLKVWDGRSGAERFTLSGHADSVTSCAVSADGATIVSAWADQTLKVWDGRSGAEHFTLSHADVVFDCAMNADGAMIVSASADQTLKVWNGHTGECMATPHVDGSLISCACSSDGEVIAAVGSSGIYFLRLIR